MWWWCVSEIGLRIGGGSRRKLCWLSFMTCTLVHIILRLTLTSSYIDSTTKSAKIPVNIILA